LLEALRDCEVDEGLEGFKKGLNEDLEAKFKVDRYHSGKRHTLPCAGKVLSWTSFTEPRHIWFEQLV
jgi:hypothetical protein